MWCYELTKFHLKISYIQGCTKMTKSYIYVVSAKKNIYVVIGYPVDQDPDSSPTHQP
jgi:hypothetical protein